MSQKNNATISEKMTELDTLLAWFDSDEFELEKAFDRFDEAQKLANDIENDLKEMKNSITVLKNNFSEES